MVKKIFFGLVALGDMIAAAAWVCYGFGLLAEPPHFSAGIEASAFFCTALFMIDQMKPS